MDNQEKNKAFLNAASRELVGSVLKEIAEHYGITQAEARQELLDEAAEHILDYMPNRESRAGLSVIMQGMGIR